MTPVRTGPLPTTSFPSPEIRVAWPDLDARDVGDGVERPGRAVERDAEVARARLRLARRRAGDQPGAPSPAPSRSAPSFASPLPQNGGQSTRWRGHPGDLSAAPALAAALSRRSPSRARTPGTGPTTDHFDGTRFHSIDPVDIPSATGSSARPRSHPRPWRDFTDTAPGPPPQRRRRRRDARHLHQPRDRAPPDGRRQRADRPDLGQADDPRSSARAVAGRRACGSRICRRSTRSSSATTITITWTCRRCAASRRPSTRSSRGSATRRTSRARACRGPGPRLVGVGPKSPRACASPPSPRGITRDAGCSTATGRCGAGSSSPARPGPRTSPATPAMVLTSRRSPSGSRRFASRSCPSAASCPSGYMHPQHLGPRDAVEAAIALRAATTVPMHFGTFPVSDDAEFQPVEELRAALEEAPPPPPRFVVLDNGQSLDVPPLGPAAESDETAVGKRNKPSSPSAASVNATNPAAPPRHRGGTHRNGRRRLRRRRAGLLRAPLERSGHRPLRRQAIPSLEPLDHGFATSSAGSPTGSAGPGTNLRQCAARTASPANAFGRSHAGHVRQSRDRAPPDGRRQHPDGPVWSRPRLSGVVRGPAPPPPPGIRFEDLPPIDAVLISHNHYDHMDLETLRRLSRGPLARSGFVGLGNAVYLRDRGVPAASRNLDWWESAPSRRGDGDGRARRHFSSRSPFDRDRVALVRLRRCGAVRLRLLRRRHGMGPALCEIGRRFRPSPGAPADRRLSAAVVHGARAHRSGRRGPRARGPRCRNLRRHPFRNLRAGRRRRGRAGRGAAGGARARAARTGRVFCCWTTARRQTSRRYTRLPSEHLRRPS